MAFQTLEDIWLWIAQDIIGSEIITVIILLVVMSMLFFRLDLPKEIILTFMIPTLLGLTLMAYLSWFGWLMIGIVGVLFGMLILELYNR